MFDCAWANKELFPTFFSDFRDDPPPKGMVLVLLQKLASIEMKNCLDDFWAIWIFGSKYDNGALRALKALFPISDLSSSLAENAWKNEREELTKEMSKFVRTVRNSKTRRDPIDLNLGREPQLFFPAAALENACISFVAHWKSRLETPRVPVRETDWCQFFNFSSPSDDESLSLSLSLSLSI